MKILITGVAGHLGSSLAAWILENIDGAEIIGIDDFSSGFAENIPPGVRFLKGRASQFSFVQADYVFHFAAMAAECLSPFVRGYHVLQNLYDGAAVLNSALKWDCRRFVFASSAAVYGKGRPPFSESDQAIPNDPYGAGKLYLETDLRIAGEQHGLPWCVLRCHNIYGPGQSIWDAHRNVLGIWMRATLEGNPIKIFGDGLQTRAFSYIGDILPCIWQAAVAPAAKNQVINLGGAQPTSILGAAELLADVTDNREIVHLPARHEAMFSHCTTEKSEAILGYEDKTVLGAGMERMWTWAQRAWRDYPERRRRQSGPPIELERGLPESWR